MPEMLIDVKVLSTGGVCKTVSLNGDRSLRKALEFSGIAYDPAKHELWVSRNGNNTKIPATDVGLYLLEQNDRVSVLQAMRGNN